MKISSILVLAVLGLGCGDDEGEGPKECPDTLEAWCATYGSCAGYETRDEALENVFDDQHSLLGASSCNDGNTIAVGDALGGRVYAYDDDGELIGALRYSDQIPLGEGCDPGNNGVGPASPRCALEDKCALIQEPFDDDLEACTGPVAEPFVALCHDYAVGLDAGCEECACTACYPTLLSCTRTGLESLTSGCADDDPLAECLAAHCADECAESLEPPAGDDDAGTP